MRNPLHPVLLVSITLLSCLGRSAQTSPSPLSPTGPPKATPAPEVLATASIAAVGDMMVHPSVKGSARRSDILDANGASTNHEGFDRLLSGLQHRVSAVDLSLVNLETPVAPEHDVASGGMIFNASPAVVDALVFTGFDVMSLANNHSWDQGRAGFAETLSILDARSVAYAGGARTCEDARKGRVFEINGIRIALLATTRLLNGPITRRPEDPCLFYLHEKALPELVASISAAREGGADIVVLSMHWGQEYHATPTNWDIDLAHDILDAGVDVIIGHHPHVLQPLEVYEAKDGRVTVVAYSLGNLISGQDSDYRFGLHPIHAGDRRDGAIMRFEVVRKNYGQGLVRTELANLSFEPTWVDVDFQRTDSPSVLVYVDRDEIEAARGRLATETEPDRIVATQRWIETLQARRERAASILGTAFVPPLDDPAADTTR